MQPVRYNLILRAAVLHFPNENGRFVYRNMILKADTCSVMDTFVRGREGGLLCMKMG